jgi:hypothetical protein
VPAGTIREQIETRAAEFSPSPTPIQSQPG